MSAPKAPPLLSSGGSALLPAPRGNAGYAWEARTAVQTTYFDAMKCAGDDGDWADLAYDNLYY